MILDLFKLDGKVAVVTGANTGLGQGMAVALAEAGAKVVGVGRRSCAETKEKIEAFGGSFTEVLADLSTTAAVDTVLSGALDAYGRVDILVNNAGIIKRCDAVDVTEADWDTVIDINEKVVFFLSQAFAKQYIKQQDGGKIINVASMLSYQGGIRVPSYTASKSAIMGLTKALANEWAKYNINVVFCPFIGKRLCQPHNGTLACRIGRHADSTLIGKHGSHIDNLAAVLLLDILLCKCLA